MNCTACTKPLTGGLDTYGAPGQPMCFDCHFGLSDEPKAVTVHTIYMDGDTVVMESLSRETVDADGAPHHMFCDCEACRGGL